MIHPVRLGYAIEDIVPQTRSSALARGLAWLGLALTVFFSTMIWQANTLAQMFDEQSVWTSGAFANGVDVSGGESGRGLFLHHYDLDVSWLDAAQHTHRSLVSFNTVGTIDRGAEVAVRYVDNEDGSAPVAAFSWSVGSMHKQWAAVLLTLAFGSAFGVVAALRGWRCLRTLEPARRALADAVAT